MTAFNVVRVRVKQGQDEAFLAVHRDLGVDGFNGARRFSMVKTGDGTYCIIGEWETFDDIVSARPKMIGLLDSMRDMLEDLGAGLGVTDPVSGEALLDMGAAVPATRARRSGPAKRKPASKARTTSARAGKPAKKKAAAKPARKAAKKPGKKPARKAAAKRKR